MNARECISAIEDKRLAELAYVDGAKETILRALRLLAAAEANDGTTPETDAMVDEIRRWAATFTTPMIAEPGPSMKALACRLERERNGLAARVRELERVESYAVHLTCEVVRAISDDNLCGREIDEILSNALAEQPAGFTAARSKP